jgi:DNA-binding transcriptional regulator LsrR (DeoR family)
MSAEEAENDTEEEEEQEGTQSPLDDEELLNELYHEEGLTQAEIGEKFDVTASTVSHYMKKHEIKTSAHRVTDERLEDPEWLEEKYIEEDMTMQAIADIVGCSDGTVMRRLRKHGIIEEPSDEEDEDEADEGEEEEEPEEAEDGDEEQAEDDEEANE